MEIKNKKQDGVITVWSLRTRSLVYKRQWTNYNMGATV